MKKRFASLACALLAIFVALGLAACGKGEEELIRSQVDAALASVSDTSEENVRARLGDEAFSRIQDQGIDPVAAYAALFGPFSYEVRGVSVERDVAQVTLTVTAVDIKAVIEGYRASVGEWASSDNATYTFDQGGQEGIEDEVVRLLGESITASELPTVTNEMTIELHRGEDGTWTPADPAQVASIPFAGVDASSLL